FLLVSPPDVSSPHIKALAHISRLLKDEEFRRTLIEVKTKEEVIALIAKEEAKYSASD
ncbi:MAG: PTS sugar transporter subunit IIA, partial [Candidatus Latescibacteria bacterium]|nr:PTS sugar transporter subunit IIA [Candidatus Latescibacterota bacterium]